ncbi:MAG: transketolase, partial [Planctomycetota bacterium]|nr:transketolase [Planctomycetota bacterium]
MTASASFSIVTPSRALLEKIADTIRFVSADQVQKANSGHPGMPMGAAEIAAVLLSKLKVDPKDDKWVNRDRFVLSAGHASSLLYAMLHLQGFLTLDDLKDFRQLGSRTPGHPEQGVTPGVDVSTGPLGAGLG